MIRLVCAVLWCRNQAYLLIIDIIIKITFQIQSYITKEICCSCIYSVIRKVVRLCSKYYLLVISNVISSVISSVVSSVISSVFSCVISSVISSVLSLPHLLPSSGSSSIHYIEVDSKEGIAYLINIFSCNSNITNSPARLLHLVIKMLKGDSKVQVLGQGGACNSGPNGLNDMKYRGLLWVTIEFW